MKKLMVLFAALACTVAAVADGMDAAGYATLL